MSSTDDQVATKSTEENRAGKTPIGPGKLPEQTVENTPSIGEKRSLDRSLETEEDVAAPKKWCGEDIVSAKEAEKWALPDFLLEFFRKHYYKYVPEKDLQAKVTDVYPLPNLRLRATGGPDNCCDKKSFHRACVQPNTIIVIWKCSLISIIPMLQNNLPPFAMYLWYHFS